MASSAKHDIDVLNSLIQTTLDSADGYGAAADRVSNASYRNLFRQWAIERRQVAGELQRRVRALGGAPNATGSTLAAGHRMLLKLRDRVADGDASVIDEIERSEDFIQARYEQALEDEALSTSARNALASAFGSIKSGHEQARNLQQSFKT